MEDNIVYKENNPEHIYDVIGERDPDYFEENHHYEEIHEKNKLRRFRCC